MGYFIGRNTNLRRLHFYHTCIDEVPSTFFRELSRNRSIKNLRILFNLLEEYIKLQMLCTFFANNHSLSDIQVEICGIFGGEGARQLALAVRSCTKSLERFKLSTLQNQIGNVVEIITALMVHPQLKQLDLGWMNIISEEMNVHHWQLFYIIQKSFEHST